MRSLDITLTCIALFFPCSEGFAPIRRSSLSTKNLHYVKYLKSPMPIHSPRSVVFAPADGNAIPSSKIMVTNNEQNEISPSSQEDGSQFSTPLEKPILAALDFISLTIFAAVGKASHSADGSLDLAAIFTTAFPFLVSWFITSPLTGVYNDFAKAGGVEDENDFLNAFKTTVKGWAIAVPLGCIGRGLIKGYVPPVPFVIVTLVATLVILSIGRMLYTAVEKQIE